jgi:hypothetical protein
VRREPARITFTVGELGALAALLLYAVGALGFLLFGRGFIVWCLVLALLAIPPVRLTIRRRRRELARARAARRAARIAARRPLWDERRVA